MNSKERVLATFEHRQTDRVPIDYAANEGINKRLMEHFGVSTQEQLLKILNVDFRCVSAPYIGPRLHREVKSLQVDPAWGFKTKWMEHSTGGYWDYCEFPLKNADRETVANWPMPSVDDYDYNYMQERCKEYQQYAVCLTTNFSIINSPGLLRSLEQTLIDIYLGDPVWQLLVDRWMDITLQHMERVFNICRGGINILWLGEDLGSQNAPLISFDVFRKQIRPRYERFIKLANHYNVKVMVHTCGSSSWAYEDFIDMGIDAVDTLQPEAKDMSPSYLKKKFGDRLAFHGCISTAGPVAYGSANEVMRNVHETLEIMMPGGGYCLAPTHQLQDNSPLENVIAMYEAAIKYGMY